MIGLAATSSHTAYYLGITAAAHPGSSSSSPKHFLLIYKATAQNVWWMFLWSHGLWSHVCTAAVMSTWMF